jgi:hypothetical protein
MSLFTTNPTPGHWLLWFLLAGLVLVMAGSIGEEASRRREEQKAPKVTPPRPNPTEEEDALVRRERK